MMMKSYLHDLQAELEGRVTDSADARKYFSTDGSIFTIMPEGVIYPKNALDVSRAVRFLADQAATGKKVAVTARGKGTDQAGGALGDGLMMVFPAHMNKVVKLGKNSVTVQPGMIYKDLQNILHLHGRFLPPYPSSIDFSTIGGAVANNACGEKTIKYGCTRDYVVSLKVVLASGQVIEAKRISARELHRKKGQMDLEGEIYRRLDALIDDNSGMISRAHPNVTKNAAGYALWDVKNRDGSFDLSKIFTGSQGTLGIITEITLKTVPFNSKTTLVVGYFDSLEKAGRAVMKLQVLKPSALEIVDYYLLEFLQKNRPQDIAGLVPDPLPKIVLLAEFDDASQVRQLYRSRRASTVMRKNGAKVKVATKPAEQDRLWRIRRSAAAVIWMTHGDKKALPTIEDGVVPVAKLPEFLTKAYALLKKYNLQIAVWGHAGNANFHMQPFMDLGNEKDRQKVFQLADEFYEMVMKLGGSTCGEHNDGLMRAPYLPKLYGTKVYELFQQTKHIFDPESILNPKVKIDVKAEDLPPLLRHEYSMEHLYDHMPHS